MTNPNFLGGLPDISRGPGGVTQWLTEVYMPAGETLAHGGGVNGLGHVAVQAPEGLDDRQTEAFVGNGHPHRHFDDDLPLLPRGGYLRSER